MGKHLIYIISFLVVLTGGIVGCKKDVDLTSSASTGSISGKCSPAWAVSKIVAVNNAQGARIEARLDSINGFNISGLQSGDYKILFSANPGFTSPDSVLVTLKAGENFDMGVVLFVRTGMPGSGTAGSISGKVSPVSACPSVAVLGIGGALLYATKPDANGNFKIDNISQGPYIIQFYSTPVFTAPSDMRVTVTAGMDTDVGTIAFNPVVFPKKAIDTMPGTVFLSDAGLIDYFVERAKMDSAIVLTGNLYMNRVVMSADLAKALNKIIVIKGAMMINNFASANVSLTFSSLKELGQLNLFSVSSLTTLDLNALEKITSGVDIYDCPRLTHLKINALNQLEGSLSLRSTSFKDLTAFSRAKFKPFNLIMENNPQLTSLKGLYFSSDSVYNCTIRNNPLLTSLDGMQGIKRFKNETFITDHSILQTLSGLDNILVAKHLTVSNNPQLNGVCGAKQLINILKDAPSYQKSQINQITGQTTWITMQPLVAFANGSYTTRADFVTAIGKCP